MIWTIAATIPSLEANTLGIAPKSAWNRVFGGGFEGGSGGVGAMNNATCEGGGGLGEFYFYYLGSQKD